MTDVAAFATPRRLHPASIVLGLPARQLVQVIVFPLLVTVAGTNRSLANGLQFFVVYAVVGLLVRTIGFQRRLFSFDGDTFRLSWGVLSRQQRTISVNRIQQIEVRRSAVARAFGLSTVRIETAASSSEPEVELRVVTHADAKALRDAVRARRDAPANGDAASTALFAVTNRHLVLAALTGNRLLALPGLVFAGFQFVGAQLGSFVEDVVEWVSNPPEAFSAFDTVLAAVALPLLVTVGVIASVLSSLLVTFLRDGRFRITRNGDELRVTRGLLATRDSLIRLNRIQLIELKQNWLRRLFGVVTVRLQSAGGDADARVVIPLIRRTDADVLIETLMGHDANLPLVRHPKAARYRSVLRWLRFAAVPILLIAFVDTITPLLPIAETIANRPVFQTVLATLMLIGAVILGLASYVLRGHAVTDALVVSQTGAANRRVVVVPIVKVQTVGVRANLFQRRLNLATLLLRVAGARSTVSVHDADSADVINHADQVTLRAATPRTHA